MNKGAEFHVKQAKHEKLFSELSQAREKTKEYDSSGFSAEATLVSLTDPSLWRIFLVCVCVCVCVLSLIHISEPTRRA